MTLLERLELVLRARGLSQHGLSVKAGLNGSHVRTLITRLKQNPHEAETRIASETLRKIAMAAGVSPEWLASGVGAMESSGTGSVAMPRLRDRSDWSTLVEVARSLRGSTPEQFFREAGNFFDHGLPIDAQFVAELARDLWDLSLRHPGDQSRHAKKS